MNPAYDDTLFYKIVSDDASAPGGAPPACASNIAAALRAVYDLGSSAPGLALLSQTFSLCQPLQTASDAAALSQWLADPWATLAMGNFPYPSSYLLNGLYNLPAWPVRAACRSPSPTSSCVQKKVMCRAFHIHLVQFACFRPAPRRHRASRRHESCSFRLLQRQCIRAVLLQSPLLLFFPLRLLLTPHAPSPRPSLPPSAVLQLCGKLGLAVVH